MDDVLQDTIDALDDLLDKERVALLAGNLELIGRILARKEALMDTLGDHSKLEFEALSDVRSKAFRNHALLGSALDGIQRVADRLVAMRRIRNSLETYDALGQRQKVVMPLKGSVEKHA